ncbi:MAG: putative metal-dependent hydrolase [Chitinophagales bacterium]|jgi:hypothetical protein|nr:putative metal-dependent hydrolase [Chitinophagales bacterium]
MATKKNTPKPIAKKTIAKTAKSIPKKTVPTKPIQSKQAIKPKVLTTPNVLKPTVKVAKKTSLNLPKDLKQISKKTVELSSSKEVVNKNIFPIGNFIEPEKYTDTILEKLIKELSQIPKQLKKVSKKIKYKDQLQLSYRDGGWTIEQIIHHLADSHMNAFIRYKLALTENNPTIKPYNQDLWAETTDIQLPVKTSIHLLKYIHKKWNTILKNMDANDFNRTYTHPEYNKSIPLKEVLASYVWHGKHHIAQIDVALLNDTTVREIKVEKIKNTKDSKLDKSHKNDKSKEKSS